MFDHAKIPSARFMGRIRENVVKRKKNPHTQKIFLCAMETNEALNPLFVTIQNPNIKDRNDQMINPGCNVGSMALMVKENGRIRKEKTFKKNPMGLIRCPAQLLKFSTQFF